MFPGTSYLGLGFRTVISVLNMRSTHNFDMSLIIVKPTFDCVKLLLVLEVDKTLDVKSVGVFPFFMLINQPRDLRWFDVNSYGWVFVPPFYIVPQSETPATASAVSIVISCYVILRHSQKNDSFTYEMSTFIVVIHTLRAS